MTNFDELKQLEKKGEKLEKAKGKNGIDWKPYNRDFVNLSTKYADEREGTRSEAEQKLINETSEALAESLSRASGSSKSYFIGHWKND